MTPEQMLLPNHQQVLQGGQTPPLATDSGGGMGYQPSSGANPPQVQQQLPQGAFPTTGMANLPNPQQIPQAQPPQQPAMPQSTQLAQDMHRQQIQQTHLQNYIGAQQQMQQQQQQSGVAQIGNPQVPSTAVVPPQQAFGFVGAPQQQQGIPQVQNPAQGFIPQAQPGQQQIQQQQQMLMPGQQGQQQGQAPAFNAQQLFDHYVNEGIDHSLVNQLIENAAQSGVQEAQLGQYLDDAFANGAHRYGDGATYNEYMGKLGNLESYLAQNYGEENVAPMIQDAMTRIHEQGGDTLLNKFNTDPEMLEPDIVMPFITGEEGFRNPYEQYAEQNNRGINLAQGNPGQAVNMGGGQNNIDAALQKFNNPQNQQEAQYAQSMEGQNQRLMLEVAKRKGLTYA